MKLTVAVLCLVALAAVANARVVEHWGESRSDERSSDDHDDYEMKPTTTTPKKTTPKKTTPKKTTPKKTTRPAQTTTQTAGSLGALYVFGTSAEVDVYDFAMATWSQVADMPVFAGMAPRVQINAYGAALNGAIYALPIPSVGSTNVYDPSTGSWSTSTPLMPTPGGQALSRFAVAATADKLYVLGGDTGFTSIQATNTAATFDPATNAWSSIASMNTARDTFGAASIDGYVYAVSGNFYYLTSSVERYDPTTNTWSFMAPLPAARYGHAVAALDGKLYVIGGQNGTGMIPLTTVEVYDPATNAWSRIADTPLGQWTGAAVGANGLLYVAGGETVNGVSNLVQVYDPASNAWSILPAQMPTAKWNTVAAVVLGAD